MINLSDKTIIVSGARGFIGHRLSHKLIGCGARVIGIDRKPFPPEAPFDSERFCGICSEIDDATEQVRESLGNVEAGSVIAFHAAGMSHAGECEQYPGRACESNITLTWQFIELCRIMGTARFVFLSTGLVYGDMLSRPACETDPTTPSNFYAYTKSAAEKIVKGYANTYGLDAIVMRMSNIYGPGAHPGSLIGMILRKIQEEEPVSLLATRPVRDYLFVDDAVDGMISVALLPNGGLPGIFNLSSSVGTSALDIAREACAIGGIDLDIEYANTEAFSYSVLENSLLMQTTGWCPSTTLSHGLSLTLKGNTP